MANANRGDVELVAGIHTFTLRISMNAMCDMESVLGAKAQSIIAEFGGGQDASISTVRGVLWGAMREHHPNMTLHMAGQVLDEVGYGPVHARIVEALMLFLPKPEAASPP